MTRAWQPSTFRGHARCRRLLCAAGMLAATLVSVVGCFRHGRIGSSRIVKTESRTLPTVGTRHVLVNTDNGSVTVRPAQEGVDTIEVRAVKSLEGNGEHHGGFQDDVDDIEILTPVGGPDDATQEITWGWRKPRHERQPSVSFEIRMPPALSLDVKTKNGIIDVVGITGDCQLRSENGAVRVVAAVGALYVRTQNGEIIIETPAADVDLQSKNGAINSRLTNSDRVDGIISSVNGDLDVYLSSTVNVDFDARAINGKVKSTTGLDVKEAGSSSGGASSPRDSFNQLTGHLGRGGGLLKLRSENGNISMGAGR